MAELAGGNGGWEIRQRRRKYPETESMKRFREANEHCGIRKGITRPELIKAMSECVPAYFKELKAKKEQGEASTSPALSVKEEVNPDGG